MAEALVECGHRVHVATYPLGDLNTPTTYSLHRVGPAHMRVGAAPGPSLKKLLFFDPLLVRMVRKLLDEIPFDIIHAHHYEGLIAALLARRAGKHVPIVYDAHTLLTTELPFYRLPVPGNMSARIGHWLDASLPRRADHTIAVTTAMRDWLITEGGMAEDRVSLVQNGVEYEHFGAPERERQDAAGSSRLDARRADAARIVYTGNLAEYQGIDLLLSAAREVRLAISNAQLILVTDSPRTPMRHHLDELGFSSWVAMLRADYDSLPRLLAQADVLVNPRPSCEGLPQKLLNYMAAARPIVSFAGSAHLLEHERTGLVVPDGDTDAFALAIIRLLKDRQLAQRLGDAARNEVIAERGWPVVANRVERAYSKVTAAPPGMAS